MNKNIETVLYNLAKILDSDVKILDSIKVNLITQSDKIKKILYDAKKPTSEDIEWAEWIIEKKKGKAKIDGKS